MSAGRSCRLERPMQVAGFLPLQHLCVIQNWQARAPRTRCSAIKQRLQHTVGAQLQHGHLERRWRAPS